MDLESALYRPIRNLPKLKINRRISIITVCLLISTIFWFLIALSASYDTRLRFPLKYQNIPGHRLIVNDLPSGMQVFVKTTGFKILAYQFGKQPDSIELDVTSALTQGKELSKELVIVPTKVLITNFTEQLGNEYSINDLYPDSIAFNFSNKSAKKVPVILRNDISYAQQYTASSSPRLNPDSVVVSGPGALIDSLRSVYTENLVLKNVKAAVNERVRIRKEHLLSTDASEVRVTIPVEKYTEGSLEIPVHVINLRQGYNIKTFPPKATIRYHVSLSNYNKVNADMFNAIADASGLPDKGRQPLKITLLGTPDFAKIISVEPDRVDYILKKE